MIDTETDVIESDDRWIIMEAVFVGFLMVIVFVGVLYSIIAALI